MASAFLGFPLSLTQRISLLSLSTRQRKKQRKRTRLRQGYGGQAARPVSPRRASKASARLVDAPLFSRKERGKQGYPPPGARKPSRIVVLDAGFVTEIFQATAAFHITRMLSRFIALVAAYQVFPYIHITRDAKIAHHVRASLQASEFWCAQCFLGTFCHDKKCQSICK